MWWRWWLLIVGALLDARTLSLSTAECSYDLTFVPRRECVELSSAKHVSVLVELGNEQQEFVMWGQADLQHAGSNGCAEAKLRLGSGSKCMESICQMRLIRFFGGSSPSLELDWQLGTVGIQTSDRNRFSFSVASAIPVDGQASVGSCLDPAEDVEDYEDETGDIDWS